MLKWVPYTQVTVDGKVYDLSAWVKRHPGGSIPLLQYAGRDMTDAFRAYHGPTGKAAKTLASCCIGEVIVAADAGKQKQVPDHVTEFRKLVNSLEGEFHTAGPHTSPPLFSST